MQPNAGSAGVEYAFTDELSAETRQALLEWDADPFQAKPWGLTWRPKLHHVIGYLNGQPVSHVGLVRETVRVGDEYIVAGGFGEVITLPAFRHRGFAQQALREATRVLFEQWELRHALLFCFPPLVPFYERLGWSQRQEPVWVLQPGGRTRMPVLSFAQAWDGAAWPPGEIEIEGLPW